MNPGLFLNFLSHQAKLDRREFLDVVGKAGIAGAIATFGLLSQPANATGARRPGGGGKFTDDIFDYADPANLSDWAPSTYGADDQRGSFNEVTRERTSHTLRSVLDHRHAVKTYNLGELMWNGFPAFVTTPARGYQQRMTLTGYPPPPNFIDGGGYLTSIPGLGSNHLSVHEERFPTIPGAAPAGLTYQIGTQLDNLNHIGAGVFFYNGIRGPDILTAQGTTKLGNEHMGPIVTRGIVLDILGLKLARRDGSALGPNAPNGKPVLRSNYRITIEDIHDALERAGIRRIERGDAVLFRTGWNQLLAGPHAGRDRTLERRRRPARDLRRGRTLPRPTPAGNRRERYLGVGSARQPRQRPGHRFPGTPGSDDALRRAHRRVGRARRTGEGPGVRVRVHGHAAVCGRRHLRQHAAGRARTAAPALRGRTSHLRPRGPLEAGEG